MRCEIDDGNTECRLVMDKTQVAPKVRIRIQRIKLVEAVISVGLTLKVRKYLGAPVIEVTCFMDSSCVLGMLQMESSEFNEFTGTREKNVQVQSNVLSGSDRRRIQPS
jgi:hypothetical protein